MRRAAAILALCAPAAAHAGPCLDRDELTIAVGVAGLHRADPDRTGGFAVDGSALLVALHARVACHLALGVRIASEHEIDLQVLGPPDPTGAPAITDVTPQVTIGGAAGALRARLSVGPAVYATSTPSAAGVGLGADGLLAIAVSPRVSLGGEAATIVGVDRSALSLMAVIAIALSR